MTAININNNTKPENIVSSTGTRSSYNNDLNTLWDVRAILSNIFIVSTLYGEGFYTLTITVMVTGWPV